MVIAEAGKMAVVSRVLAQRLRKGVPEDEEGREETRLLGDGEVV